MTDMKKSKVENRILDVVSYDEYTAHPELYHNTSTGVEFNHNGKTVILPHRSTSYSEDRPGVYNCGSIDRFVFPNEENESEYTQEIIDFSDVDAIGKLTTKMDKVRDLEREILTSPDNIFTPTISENDSPEMRGLKEAVIAKHIDIDKYADRFGDNFPNDKRQFKKGNITLFMMKRMCDCLDMKAELTISDASPDVPNPIGKPIVIDITSGDIDSDMESEEGPNGELY